MHSSSFHEVQCLYVKQGYFISYSLNWYFQNIQIPLLIQWNQYFINYGVIIERKYQS